MWAFCTTRRAILSFIASVEKDGDGLDHLLLKPGLAEPVGPQQRADRDAALGEASGVFDGRCRRLNLRIDHAGRQHVESRRHVCQNTRVEQFFDWLVRSKFGHLTCHLRDQRGA
jgi:hypothetical protein